MDNFLSMHVLESFLTFRSVRRAHAAIFCFLLQI